MNRRRFVQSSLAATVAASLPAKQSMAALLSLTTEVSADVHAITGDRVEVILKQSAVQDLSDSLRGRLLIRGDDGYDKARRVREPSFDKYPRPDRAMCRIRRRAPGRQLCASRQSPGRCEVWWSQRLG